MAAAAGWYAAPSDPAQLRYWDGAAWTEHRAPAYAPPPAQPTYTQPTYSQTSSEQTTYGQPGYGLPAASLPAYGQPAHGYGQPGPQIRKFGFGEAVRRGFHKWTDYSGRATVAEYWWFYLFEALVVLALYIVLVVVAGVAIATSNERDPVTGDKTLSGAAVGVLIVLGVLLFVAFVVLFFPQLAVSVRRLHDTDKSGWWYLLSLVPFGGIVILIFMILPGTPGPNRYGEPVTA